MVIQQTIDFLVKDEFADQPSPIRRVARRFGVFAGEQILVRNYVSILEPSELLCQCLGGLAGQLAV